MPKIAVIGGFLGAGKTTTILESAKRLARSGRQVGIITNDQGEELVDTKIARDLGFASSEVPGGCFCCQFPDFIASIQRLLKEREPEIILAEPVGSCADVPASIHEPLRKFYRDLEIAPPIVIVDALQLHRLSESASSTSNPIEYLISSQIREAGILAVNKIDLVPKEKLEDVKSRLKKLNPEAEMIEISAKKGTGLDTLIQHILSLEYKRSSYPEVDYKAYGAAEAELGWLNGSWEIAAEKRFNVERFLSDLLTGIAEKVKERKGEVAHIKAYFTDGRGSTKASLVMSGQDVEFTQALPEEIEEGVMIVNARVRIKPAELAKCVSESLEAISSKHHVRCRELKVESFSPLQPQPHHRFIKLIS